MLKKPLTSIVITTALFATSLATAAPATNPSKQVFSDKALQLAMLDLNRQVSKKSAPKISQKRSVRKKHLISKRKTSVKLPSNCLKWSANQINRKAKQFEKPINDYSRQYRVDKNLIKAVITAESCFKVKAKSHANAQGLMQLIPATAKRFGVKSSYNPTQNIRGGVKYLKFLKERFKGNLKKIIAAYNAGEGAVDKYKGIPPYKETQNYVKNVLMIYQRLNPKAKGRVSATYDVVKKGQKPGRHGWEYNKKLAPHLYKK